MTKWSAVFVGFILAVFVKSFFAQYEFVGLLIVGFITGVLVTVCACEILVVWLADKGDRRRSKHEIRNKFDC